LELPQAKITGRNGCGGFKNAPPQIFNMEFFRQSIEAYPQATKEKDTKGDLFCTMFVR